MKTKQRDVTREKLLQAAFCEIHRQGFQAASIANIICDTGLTKGALYHHFPTKQAIGLAVIEEVIQVQLDELIFRPLRESEQPVDTLLEIMGSIHRKVDVNFIKFGCPLNNLMQEMSPLDEMFKSKVNGVLALWRQGVEEALRRGIEQGQIRADVDCGVATLFITSAWEGCIGVAKNLQCPDMLALCMSQLQVYVRGLMVVDKA